MNDVVVPINYIAVFAAAVASMVIGTIWYGPLFGAMWMKELGMKQLKMTDEVKKQMMKQYSMMFVGSIIMAFVLGHSLVFASTYLKLSGLSAGVQTGFWNWLGFVAPVTLGSVLWEGKSWRLWGINNGYYVITLVVMGCIMAQL